MVLMLKTKQILQEGNGREGKGQQQPRAALHGAPKANPVNSELGQGKSRVHQRVHREVCASLDMMEKPKRGTDLAHLGHGKAMKAGSIIKAKLPKALFIICGLHRHK